MLYSVIFFNQMASSSRANAARVCVARISSCTICEDAVRVKVQAAVTHTIGGLRIDEEARVVGAEGLWAAGADAGGIFTGGYASGLAAALVFGRRAAESVDRITRR